MTSGLASASPGRAARPNRTPHVHMRVSTISVSFARCLADHGRTARLLGTRLAERPAAKRAPLKALYTRAQKNKTHQSKKGRRARTGATTVPKTNNKVFVAPPHRAGGQACTRLARHVAALHRVAPDLHVALRGIPRLRRIAEHAAALAAEALEARRGRRSHEIVVGVLFGDLVDHARALIEELLLAGVPLHALEDV